MKASSGVLRLALSSTQPSIRQSIPRQRFFSTKTQSVPKPQLVTLSRIAPRACPQPRRITLSPSLRQLRFASTTPPSNPCNRLLRGIYRTAAWRGIFVGVSGALVVAFFAYDATTYNCYLGVFRQIMFHNYSFLIRLLLGSHKGSAWTIA